ncbi:hypothetical protein Ahy_A01g001207 isoform B [Arachis hypogaea]|uniref:DnaJ homologue subfamily C GRV2/DNAJC13 N-terminal domain-containing protein n=1 Tax=Arachis hypogaea TaxID=3818 RepID=A0A445EME9_ARAHY|nr:hypothetical protein Ahy_A01g001207 isoform B [Arachis hypogaea]
MTYIVPIQFFVPPSQQTTTDVDSEPTPMLQIEGARETTPETPKQHQETTPKLPPAPTKIHPDAEEAAALLMMARTASYVPKTDLPMPSFSLGLTDSSQEGASTQETEREKSPEAATMLEQLDSLVQKLASSASKGKDKSPQIRRETGGESSAKFETPGGTNQIPNDMKEKCYIWGTRLKEDAKGDTNEFEEICTLTGQGQYILMRTHLASLQANSDIECQVVSAICLILNQKKEKRFHAQIYCLPPDIVSMALSDHPKGEFISPKTNREFRVEAYPNFIPFIDRKKLSSHPYGYVFSRLIAYAGGKPLEKGEKKKEIKAPYVKISGQKTSYDCAIYVMKWLELIEPENIKKGKYEWDNWTQTELMICPSGLSKAFQAASACTNSAIISLAKEAVGVEDTPLGGWSVRLHSAAQGTLNVPGLSLGAVTVCPLSSVSSLVRFAEEPLMFAVEFSDGCPIHVYASTSRNSLLAAVRDAIQTEGQCAILVLPRLTMPGHWIDPPCGSVYLQYGQQKSVADAESASMHLKHLTAAAKDAVAEGGSIPGSTAKLWRRIREFNACIPFSDVPSTVEVPEVTLALITMLPAAPNLPPESPPLPPHHQTLLQL